ncbi:MAG: capsular polysaccharide synthesis protein [Marinosulfonomonas sp.]
MDVHESQNYAQRDNTIMPITPPDQNPKIGFVHIPKCGGTSLEVALGIAKSYPDLGVKKTVTDADKSVIFGGGLQHLTVRELRRNYSAQWNELDESFTVVRDPLDRIISHIFWGMSRFEEFDGNEEDVILRLKKRLEKIENHARGNDLFQNPTIGNEYDNTDPNTLSPKELAQRHLLPQSAYIFDQGIVGVDKIFLLDHMDTLETHLKSLGGLSGHIEKRMSRGSHHDFASKIPEELKSRIREIYRHDFELVDIVRRVSEDTGLGYCTGPALQSAMQNTSNARGMPPAKTTRLVPRKLFLYWHQGWDSAPELMQYCRDSWAIHNPGWELCLLTKDNLHEYVSLPGIYVDNPSLTLAALSDVIRIHLLAEHGGVWADATTFCTRPLDEWIDRCTPEDSFFAFIRPVPGEPISSWFISAHPDSDLIHIYRDAVNNFWQQFTAGLGEEVHLAVFTGPKSVKLSATDGTLSKRRLWFLSRKFPKLHNKLFKNKHLGPAGKPTKGYYFWFHEIFQALKLCNPKVSSLWKRTAEVTADAPHFVQKTGMCTPITPELDFHITNRMSNMYKLNRREELPSDLNGTALGLLIDMHLGQSPKP